MEQLYASLRGLQTVRARLDTLVNIVRAWPPSGATAGAPGLAHAARRPPQPRLGARRGPGQPGQGLPVFLPRGHDVAPGNVQGIGWQGVPDQLTGLRPPLRGESCKHRAASG
jgi:hypothetical protein